MLTKRITFFGQPAVLACDGRCDKAWGLNLRPRLYFMEEGQPPRALRKREEPRDFDDHVYVADDALGTAPEDPGTYEGGFAKPSDTPLEDPSEMNKWCSRECERSGLFKPDEPIDPPDLSSPKPNKRARA